MAETHEIHRENLTPVHSRVSWGALFAGLFITLTVFLILSHLGAAIGISVADGARDNTIATGAGIWAVAAALLAFFCGGCATSLLTAGESRAEAAVYGTILWGLTFTLLLWVTGSVVRTGFTAMLGTANVAANATPPYANWEQAAGRAGLTEAQIAQLRAQMPGAARAQGASVEAAWWSLAGVIVSLLASVGGAVACAGPRSALGGTIFRRTTIAVVPGG